MDNCDIGRGIREVTFRDDAGIWPALPDTGVDALSPFARAEEIESLQAAIYSYSGWFDGAHQRAAISHWSTRTAGSRLIIGPGITVESER